ncbi:MAG: ribonucleoside-diphosphate reductase [Gammaproteobacteria bacterium]|nr:MAG: ribonucleoside-diphosphate reductase [Gammaproteobacteria bacterium]
MKIAVKMDTPPSAEIPFQEASLDIWEKKYRLATKDGTPVDRSIQDTYARVARALADVEAPEVREYWYERFVWALQRGAIPAGRITSNAGALAHKPATSTINCTVSGTIEDSMDDILNKVHEAGLTLKAGCGIGYEFSTLRPRGAYVSGAGAYTSGPLSFMDIYDRMCFTVSSAGGRRGAQMGTFDVGHPDALDFVRAKREDGRLRQFNLSLLITDEFMQAVREDQPWRLAFPVTEAEVRQESLDLADEETFVWREWPGEDRRYARNEVGLVACKVYRTVPARRVWDVIMASTYDFAEPGFVLIDRVNEMNNNWWCEDIRATNPCVTADTWVNTGEGPRQVGELLGRRFSVRVDGRLHDTTEAGFFQTGIREVLRLETAEGHTLRLTPDHRVRRVTGFAAGQPVTAWCEAGELRRGDRVLLQDHRHNPYWTGELSEDEGYLLGMLVSRGRVEQEQAWLSLWRTPVAANAPYAGIAGSVRGIMGRVTDAAKALTGGTGFVGWQEVPERGEYRLAVPGLSGLARRLGLAAGSGEVSAAVERTSSRFHAGFLRAWFDVRGRLEERDGQLQLVLLGGNDVNLGHDGPSLGALQRMLQRLGVIASVDAQAGQLMLRGSNLAEFARRIGFADTERQQRLESWLAAAGETLYQERFIARVSALVTDGVAEVYDVQVPGVNCFDGNGLHAHNCGEQPLPPYGSCLLGSVNLTKFVIDPFTDKARFDWEQYRDVVRVFTRMLDNVVEINGLPLGRQREEITRKRRHGMGFLGLGSTITMMTMKYGSRSSVAFTQNVSREMALAGWETALELAREKGPAPIMLEEFTVTPEMLRKRPEMVRDGYQPGDRIPGRILHSRYSRYMQRVADAAPELVDQLAEVGARFTHHSSIAPTGTISLSLANNASNGIEPSFAHHYFRNVIREGRKSKERVDVFSFELLAYRHLINPKAMPFSDKPEEQLPEYFTVADDVTPTQHVDIQAAAQLWVDSSISKTANVPTDYDYEDFKDIYMYAYEQGLKGCTTFRFNPEAFQGVLVKESDLKNTTYVFTLEDGSEVKVRGDEEIEYDGEVHTAANLYDALKEGYYGKF